MFDRDEWLASHKEEIVDPDRAIIDPHHHLWAYPDFGPYLLEQLWADTESGHKVKKTIYIECGWGYDRDASEDLQSLGETKFLAAVAAEAAKSPSRPQIAGHIGHINLKLPHVNDLLDRHLEASNGLLRGIRHHAASETDEALLIRGHSPQRMLLDKDFQRGVKTLGDRGLTYDSWHYHHQNAEFLSLARAVPETTMVLDHLGSPLGVARFSGRRDEVFADWKLDMRAIAACPNVVAKLGGFAMPDNGWGWMEQDKPPSSDELLAAQGEWYEHMLTTFGAERCMFESNFPVDRVSVSYPVLWNFFKKLAHGASENEKAALFSGTARRVYGLPGV